MGSLGLTIANEVIYKIDKSIFDYMDGLHLLIDYDVFDKVESIMKDIWFRFRPPTEEEKNWLYFIYGKKEDDPQKKMTEADRLINDAHFSREKITGGESMNSYISRIKVNDKEKLNQMNNSIDNINKEITMIKEDMAWIQESYGATVNRHRVLLNSIYETVYPKFFANLSLERFGIKKSKPTIMKETFTASSTIESINKSDD